MSNAISVLPPFPIYADKAGKPLESGYIYIGEENQNPQMYPIATYWDAERTITAAQPIRTIGGYPARNGSPATIYTADRYSITVLTSGGQLVYYSPGPTTSLDMDDILRVVNVRDLLSGAHFTYTDEIGKETVTAGQLIVTDEELFVYAVAAANATNQNLTTDDGVKLYIIPGWPNAACEQFGVRHDSTAAQNDAGFILAMAWLNGASYRHLTLGAGVFDISQPLPAMTRSNTGFSGAGREVTSLSMAEATVSGNFITVGDGTEGSASRVVVSGLRLVVNNETTASGYMFDIDGTADVIIEDIAVTNAAGVIRVGETAKTSRLRFTDIRGDFNDTLDHRVGLFKRWTGMLFDDVVLYGGGTFARTVPTFDFTTIGLCDTLDWNKVTAWTRTGSAYGIFINCDNGTFVNADFNRIVLDKTGLGGAAVWMEMTAASTSTETDFWKIQNVMFDGLRADTGGDTPGGKIIYISQGCSTGWSRIRGITFANSLWTPRTEPAFISVSPGTDVCDDIKIIGGAIREAFATTVTNAIEIGTNRVSVIGLSSGFAERVETGSIDNFVAITDPDVDEFLIASNIVFNIQNELIVEPVYTVPGSLKRRVFGNTYGDGDRVQAQTITTNRGPTLVIAAGAATVTHSFHAVDTEAAAATDDLVSLAMGLDGQMVTLTAANAARVVTCKDGAAVANTLALAGDFALTDIRDRITLQCDLTAQQWVEISRSNNS